MRKTILMIWGLLIILLAGCSEDKALEIVEIKEKMFIEQCNDIYLNPGDYKNKIVELEGIYDEYSNKEGKLSHFIYRKSPGCCGNDGEVGFLFTYDGKMPKPNDWIRVSGKIDVEKTNAGYDKIVMRLNKLDVLNQRGVEFVTK